VCSLLCVIRIQLVGSLKMNTALEYSTRVVQEGDRRCKKSTLNFSIPDPSKNTSNEPSKYFRTNLGLYMYDVRVCIVNFTLMYKVISDKIGSVI
jgi:hypothetical protein